MDSLRLNKLLETKVMRRSFTSKSPTRSHRHPSGNLTYRADTDNSEDWFQGSNEERRGRSLPSSLSSSEFVDINRCFKRVNVKVEGYLDFEELKEFMELRLCPITDWEATKLLEYADPTYHYYISLEQIIELTTLYGFGTHHPVQMTRSEFDTAIRHAFRLTSTHTIEPLTEEEVLDFNGALKYFESKIAEEREREESQRCVSRGNRDVMTETENDEENHISIQLDLKTKNKVILDQEPRPAVKLLTRKWENEVNGGRTPRSRMNSSYYPKSVTLSKNTDSAAGNTNTSSTGPNFISIPGPKSPSVKSIYRRNNASKAFSTGELFFKSKAKGYIYETSNVGLMHSYADDKVQDEKSRLSKKIFSPPPLPSPIVPDIPAEWRSSNKNNSTRHLFTS